MAMTQAQTLKVLSPRQKTVLREALYFGLAHPFGGCSRGELEELHAWLLRDDIQVHFVSSINRETP